MDRYRRSAKPSPRVRHPLGEPTREWDPKDDRAHEIDRTIEQIEEGARRRIERSNIAHSALCLVLCLLFLIVYVVSR